MRVHEIAKRLNISSKEVLTELKRMRVPVKNHMSQVDDKDVERLETLFERRRDREEEQKREDKGADQAVGSAAAPAGTSVPPPPRPKGSPRPQFFLKTKRGVTNKAKQEAIEKAKAAREARKKTIKEKRAHRPPPAQVAKLLKKKAQKRQEAKAEKAAKEKTRTKPPKKMEKIAAKSKDTPSKQKAKSKKKKKPLHPGEIVIPTIEVMSFKELKKDIAERWRKRSKGKKAARKSTDKSAKHGKKIRPSFYLNLEEQAKAKVKKPKPSKRKRMDKPKVKKITIHGEITVEEFAHKIEIHVSEIISNLEMMGEQFEKTHILPHEYIELLSEEFDIQAEIIPEDDQYDVREFLVVDNPENMKPRPPVVTIMGHVDHGKTTLLDSIRKSDIVSKEYGGITQHIGAYTVQTPQGKLVFLDTPGHEAFTAMRARGAKTTDIVVLVVAADDGVMPQTSEAINHAKAAGVPIIIAINKIDKPGSNPDRIKQELMKYDLVPEELGGETLYAEVAARTGENVEKLLELIHLQSEILELIADPNRPAEGAVLESHMDPLRGVIATALVEKGTLRNSDVLLCGDQFGRVRAMINDHGQSVDECQPSTPVEVVGFTGVPEVGEPFLVMPDEKEARRIAGIRTMRRRSRGLRQSKHVTLENLQSYMSETETKELKMILKGDVQGSIEAVSQSLEKLSTEKVKINIIHSGVGSINDSDVNLADASDAIIIGFNVRPEASAMELAQEEGVEIALYRVIYELLDEVKKAMEGLLEPIYNEVVRGRAEVRQVFKISRLGNIAGSFVLEGEVHVTDKARLLRDNVVVYEGSIGSLRRVKDDVKKVPEALECGISLQNYNDIKEGDIIESYYLEEIPQEL